MIAKLDLITAPVASGRRPWDQLQPDGVLLLVVGELLGPARQQSATVWHSSLTEEDKSDLERVQIAAIKVKLQTKCKGYQNGLALLGIEDLESRRKKPVFKICQEMFQKWENVSYV